MLTSDLVCARIRDGKLLLQRFDHKRRDRAHALAESYLNLASQHVGEPRHALETAFRSIRAEPRDQKLAAGLRKLVLDRCTFDIEQGAHPASLREELFASAAAAWRDMRPGDRFARAAIVEQYANTRELGADVVDRLLYADLKQHHRLSSFARTDPLSLIADYQLGQSQAVLLKATQVTLVVACDAPASVRALFRKMKFLRLLFSIDQIDEKNYRIRIDGPCSLFDSVTRYGLQLALLLPQLRYCDRWRLSAEILWGKDRRRVKFETSADLEVQMRRRSSSCPEDAGSLHQTEPSKEALPPELETLLRRFNARNTPWRVRRSTQVWSQPGIGLTIPDLVFKHVDHDRHVYLELLGYWSRKAVWQRVEMAERGLAARVLYAVSSRLRVSEAALGEDLPAAIYVFKGVLSARSVEEHLERLAQRSVCDMRDSGRSYQR